MILLKPLSCQKFLYNISVTKTNEPQNDRAKVQIKYEKFIFIGAWRSDLRHAFFVGYYGGKEIVSLMT